MTDPSLYHDDTQITPPLALLQLSGLAQEFGINPDRVFFPVNSLRLLYLLLLKTTTKNPAAIQEMATILPHIEIPKNWQRSPQPLHATTDILALLHTRATDSDVSAARLLEVMRKYWPTENLSEPEQFAPYMYHQLHRTVQLNDCIDSIVFHTEESTQDDPSLIDLLHQSGHNSARVKQLIGECVEFLTAPTPTDDAFPQLAEIFTLYNTGLVSVLG